MHKNPLKPKQDRSLSVDISNSVLPLVLNSNYGNIPDSRRQNSVHRSSPSMNLNQQAHIRNALEEQVINFAYNSSPQGPNKSRKASISIQSSNVKQRSSSKLKKSDQSMNMSTGHLESENTVLLNNAIQNAYNVQIDKEKQIKESQIKTEKELVSLKVKLADIERNIKAQRDRVNLKQSGLIGIMQQMENMVQKSGNNGNNKGNYIDFWRNVQGKEKELERKEMLKMIVGINKDLTSDLRVLEGIMREGGGYTGTGVNFRSVINSTEESLKCLMNEKTLLIQKMYSVEEKLHEASETKHMIVEDIHSHIVSVTECVVLQEEIDFVLESLRAQNPEYYEKIFQELELHEKIVSLGFKIKKKEDDLKQLMKENTKDEEKHSQLLEEAHKALIEIETLRDMESARKRDIIAPKLTIYQKTRELLDKMLVNKNEEGVKQLEEYLKVFKLDDKVKMTSGECEVKIIEYQGQVLQEMQLVLRMKQEVESLENTLLQLHLDPKKPGQNDKEIARFKADPNFDINAVTKSLQDEIINRKLGLTEKIVAFGFSKAKIVNGITGNIAVQKLLMEHSKLSFFDVVKKLAMIMEAQVFQRFSEAMMGNIKSLRGQLEEYRGAQVKGQKKSEDLRGLNSVIQSVKRKISENNGKIQQETAKLKGIKEEEAMYRRQCEVLEESCRTEIASEAQKAYQNYVQEHEKHLKKLKFQYGKSFVSKLTNTIMDDYINSNKSVLNKFKEDIKEAYRMTVKMEEYRAQTGLKIENELKKAYEENKEMEKEYQGKLGEMNEELLGIVEKESRITRGVRDNAVVEGREEGYPYREVQEYKERVSELMRSIVQGLGKGERISGSDREKVRKMIWKLQEELQGLVGSEMKTLEQMEREEKEHVAMIESREAKTKYYKDQLQRSQLFWEISGNQVTKKKEAALPPTVPVHKSEGKSMSSSKKRLKGHLSNSRSVSKLQINLKENVEPDRSIGDSAPASVAVNLNLKFITPKVGLEQSRLWSGGSRSRLNSHSLSKTPSLADFSNMTGRNASGDMSGEKTTKRVRNVSRALGEITGYQATPKQQEKSYKGFSLSEKQYRELMREFEEGIPVYKKLNTNTSIDMKDINVKNEKTQEIKGFGKRVLRLNVQGKTIEVVKPQVGLVKPSPEYSYSWKSLRKVFIPPFTLKSMKGMMSEEKGEGDILQFTLEVEEKGKIDFLTGNVWHLALLFNVVNQIVAQGKVALPTKE